MLHCILSLFGARFPISRFSLFAFRLWLRLVARSYFLMLKSPWMGLPLHPTFTR